MKLSQYQVQEMAKLLGRVMKANNIDHLLISVDYFDEDGIIQQATAYAGLPVELNQLSKQAGITK